MKAVKVNNFIWNALSQEDKQQISAHLKHFGVIQQDDYIVGDKDTPLPQIDSIMNIGSNTGKHAVMALGVDWMCRAICDSMEGKTNCALYGQSTRLCVESITKFREIFDMEVLHK